jgi:hypothetical protein
MDRRSRHGRRARIDVLRAARLIGFNCSVTVVWCRFGRTRGARAAPRRVRQARGLPV